MCIVVWCGFVRAECWWCQQLLILKWELKIKFESDFTYLTRTGIPQSVRYNSGTDVRGIVVRFSAGAREISYPKRPDQLLGPPSLLSIEYREDFLWG